MSTPEPLMCAVHPRGEVLPVRHTSRRERGAVDESAQRSEPPSEPTGGRGSECK